MAIVFKDVCKSYGSGPVVLRIPHLELSEGALTAVVGPSGCGKSTLLRLVASLSRPTRGEVRIGGNGARAEPPGRMGIVFQDATLLPWLDVRRNIELPLRLRGIAAPERREAAREQARRVGLGGVIDRHPAQLSGGMKMRVSLARALAADPAILLLDEPFGALDALTRDRLNEELSALQERGRWTAVFVTHSVTEAVFLADRILVFSPGPGEVAGDIAVDLPRPRRADLRETDAFHRLVTRVSGMVRNPHNTPDWGDDPR